MRNFLLFILIAYSTFIFSQKSAPFSGEITYQIERVDREDTVKAMQLIYAKDSLIKIVTISSDKGKQELIKHLTYNKSYLLIESPLQNFAVRTNEHLLKDSVKTYTFKKKFGTKKIAGLRAKKVSVKLESVKKDLIFLYLKKIPTNYANCYFDLPGLPVLFYISTPDGLFRYTLQKLKYANPPLELFMIPKDFKKVSFDEFAEEFSKLYESKE